MSKKTTVEVPEEVHKEIEAALNRAVTFLAVRWHDECKYEAAKDYLPLAEKAVAAALPRCKTRVSLGLKKGNPTFRMTTLVVIAPGVSQEYRTNIDIVE